MQKTGHLTDAFNRRYAITSDADLREGVDRLDEVAGTTRGDKRRSATLKPAEQFPANQ